MQTQQSPMGKRLDARNAKKIEAERVQMYGDTPISATERQLPQRGVFGTSAGALDENGDRHDEDGLEGAVGENYPENNSQGNAGKGERSASQRVLFGEDVRETADLNGSRESEDGLEGANYENSLPGIRPAGFPVRLGGGKAEDQGFHGLEGQPHASGVPAKKSLMDRFSTESFTAQPETFIVNKICSLVPVEGTALAKRFATLRNSVICSMSGAYRELVKEPDAKERFLSFEKEFESAVGIEVMQVAGIFNGWMIENCDCNDDQAMAFTLLVATRRLMADKGHPDRYRHAKVTLDFLGCYLSQADSQLLEFRGQLAVGSIQGCINGGDFDGLYRLGRSVSGMATPWMNEFGDMFQLLLELLQGVEHVVVDVASAVKAFKGQKGQKSDMTQRINKDGTVEGVVFWYFRMRASLSVVERVAGLAQRPDKVPSVTECVEVAFNTLNVTFMDKGVFKVLEAMEGLCWTKDSVKLPIFGTWTEFMVVLQKAEAIIRRREMTGWRVPHVSNWAPGVTKPANTPPAIKADAPAAAATGVCPHFAKFGSCNRGDGKCNKGSHPGQQEKKVKRATEAAAHKLKEDKRRGGDDVMVAADGEFVPPKPTGDRVVGSKADVKAGADDVMVAAVVYKIVGAECRECKKHFKSDEKRYLGIGHQMPRSCPECCINRAKRMQETALMVEADYTDEDEEEVMMVVEAGRSCYERCEAEAEADCEEVAVEAELAEVTVSVGDEAAVCLAADCCVDACEPCVLAVSMGVGESPAVEVEEVPEDSPEVVPWLALQQIVGGVHGAMAGASQERFREKIHYMTLRKLVREAAPMTKVVRYVDDWLMSMSVAWCQAVVKVLQRLQDTEGLKHLEHGTANEELWLQRLINAVLQVDDDYARIERRSVKLSDGTSVAYLTEVGVDTLRQCFRGVMFVLGEKMRKACDARWVAETSRLRLVSREFAAGVAWYASQEPVTRRLRDFRSGRQRTLGEFYDDESVFLGWKCPRVLEAMPPSAGVGVSFPRMDGHGSITEVITSDDALASEFAILQMDPIGKQGRHLRKMQREASPIVCKNRFEALTAQAQSCGNRELDERERMDTAELSNRLRMATEARSKRVCQQDTPVKQAWEGQGRDESPFRVVLHHPRQIAMTLAEEFEAQESDSSEDDLRPLCDYGAVRAALGSGVSVLGSDSDGDSMPELNDVVLDDYDESGGDSEYWEAMEDSDLSDATVRTGSEGESSDSDFQ